MEKTDKLGKTGWAQNWRLRTTIIVPFVVQIFASVALVGYLSFRNGEKAINNLATQLSVQVTARINQRLENYFNTPHLVQQIKAMAVRTGNLDLSNFDKLQHQFWREIQLSNAIDSLYYGNESGDLLAVQKYEDGRIVVKIRDENTAPKRVIYELNAQGDRTKLLKSKEYDPRLRPWYKGTIAANAPNWTSVYISEDLAALQISPSTPVYDEKGKFIGVFSTNLILSSLNDFLNQLKISKSGDAFLLERSGELIASSTDELPFVKNGKDQLRLNAKDSKKQVIQSTFNQLISQFGNLSKINSPQHFTFYLKGKKQLVQVSPIEGVRGIDWVIVVVIPELDFMEEINANTRNTILLCLLTLVLAILMGIFTARLITRPVIRLTQLSKELADGNLDQRVETIDVIEIEEIETLEQSFNKMAGQLQEAFETLEDKVKERTAELAVANEEIIALNEKLKEENLRMGAELDVARQLQMMILPKPEELENLEGLDLAGYMEPADEVGGDYYDVLHTNGIVTLGIGDVTGHGLESGILMLMTQTAVRTLQEIRQIDPVVFLDTLNRTIYKNVQRMNSEKSLTLAIINYGDGKVSISGQHEETLLIRKGGKVERIDTMDLGFPIGLDEEIADFISHATFELEEEEGIVLYTDGIPEAKDINKVQYGVERLCEIISENWEKSANDIKEAVIADVRRHIGKQKVFDDITLLVLKRLKQD